MATATEQKIEAMTLDQEKRIKDLERRMDEAFPEKDAEATKSASKHK